MKPLRTARKVSVPLAVLGVVGAAGAAHAVAACESETPTHAVVDNAYPALPDGGDPTQQTVVYRAWWVTTYFPNPVAGGASSTEQRSVQATGVAYAVLATGWDPSSATPPTSLVVVRSKAPLSSTRGSSLRIAVSDETFIGSCAAKQPLAQADADFITQSIFPGEFVGFTYDAATCTLTAIPEAGAGGAAEGGRASDASAADASAADAGDADAGDAG